MTKRNVRPPGVLTLVIIGLAVGFFLGQNPGKIDRAAETTLALMERTTPSAEATRPWTSPPEGNQSGKKQHRDC